jgi:Rod binding domain-containing protein
MIAPVPLRPTPAPDDRKALQQAAAGFESLVLAQMLKAAHPERQGPDGDARTLADQALARELSAGSPFGIAKLLEGPTR